MKKIFIILITSIIYSSCTTNKYEKKLIGNWYNISEYGKLEFNKDSLIFSESYFQPYKWRADNSSILFSNLPSFLTDSIIERKLIYKIIDNNLLVIYNKNDKLIKDSLLRSDSFTNFLFKKNKIGIKLETNSQADYIRNFHNGIKIFIGYKNDSIITKSEYSDSIDNLDEDLKNHLLKISKRFEIFKEDVILINQKKGKELTQIELENLHENWIISNVYYSVFADSKIPKEKINECIDFLKRGKIKDVYQIYSRIEDYRDADFNVMKGIKK